MTTVNHIFKKNKLSSCSNIYVLLLQLDHRSRLYSSPFPTDIGFTPSFPRIHGLHHFQIYTDIVAIPVRIPTNLGFSINLFPRLYSSFFPKLLQFSEPLTAHVSHPSKDDPLP